MQLGVVLRNMGPQSTRETLVAAARAADGLSAIADLWVVDHIAIPPDDAEGSDGRYLDPLATLAYLAGVTTRVGLGAAARLPPGPGARRGLDADRPRPRRAPAARHRSPRAGRRQESRHPGGRRPDSPPARRPRRRARPPRALRRGRRDARDPR